MYKNKLKILLFGIIIFMCTSVNVFAACTAHFDKASCESQSEDNFKCVHTEFKGFNKITGMCKKSTTDCITGYFLSGNRCVKSSSTGNDFSIGWYICNNKCQKGYTNGCNTQSYLTYKLCSDNLGKNTGPFCGTYKSQGEKDSGKTQVTKEQCNALYSAANKDKYRSDWSSSSNCCSITLRNTGTGGGSKCPSTQYGYNGTCYALDKYNCEYFKLCDTDSRCSGKCGSKTTSYSVVFDSNYGTALTCDSPLKLTTPEGSVPIKCEGTTTNSSINVPSSSSKMNYGGKYLLGWSNTFVEGQLVCSSVSKSIITDSSVNLTSGSNGYYACYEDTINGTRYALSNSSADGQEVKNASALKITKCYKNSSDGRQVCEYTEISGTSRSGLVYRDRIALSQPNTATVEQTPTEEEVKKEDIKCTTKDQKNVSGEYDFYMCVDEDDYDDEDDYELKRDASKLVLCKSGYELEDISISGNIKDGYVQVFAECVREGNKTGTSYVNLSVTSGNLGSDGKTGVISVRATSTEGKIEKYYVSETYKTPTSRSDWTEVNSGNFTITTTPGIVYIWVMDSEGNISNGIGGAVFDTVNTNTTASKIELQDANGNIQSPTSNTAYKVKGITSSDYVRLSNSLNKESVIADNGFNPFEMEYKLEVASPTITVYATLTSTDASYVPGYEPRTVNLDYGINTILIKIQNNEGIVRTYTILVTRTDDRKADNTINALSVDVGNIEFNSNKAEYKIEIPKSTKKVNVTASLASDKASFIDGYEPGEVEITSDATVKLLKVKSETGSTRTYVLTFIKEGTDVINDESLQLFSLSIPGANLPFEKEISNYSLSVGYSSDVINLNSVVNSENSKVIYKLKRLSDSDYNIVSNKGISLDVGENFIEIIVMNESGSTAVYRLTIIRKEDGLELSNDTTLGDLKVLGYDIEFNPQEKEYTVRIKQEKSLVITAIPNSTRSEVFIRGNDELTGFSTVRIKVVAENGEYDTYSIDIKKDAFNKPIEIIAVVVGVVIILASSCIIVIKNKNRKRKEYFEE